MQCRDEITIIVVAIACDATALKSPGHCPARVYWLVVSSDSSGKCAEYNHGIALWEEFMSLKRGKLDIVVENTEELTNLIWAVTVNRPGHCPLPTGVIPID